MSASVKARRERFEPVIWRIIHKAEVFALSLETSNSRSYGISDKPGILLMGWAYFPQNEEMRGNIHIFLDAKGMNCS